MAGRAAAVSYTHLDVYKRQVRTFCMNPKGVVVNENTNGIVTVNGHSYEDENKHTENTNFALLVAKHFSEPFKDSNGYGESIARLSNMLGGGVIVQRFGDLIRGRRSNKARIEENFVTPTLSATPGDLSLVMPKRILDGIIEMIYALDKIAPGTANDDTLLYGVEVKFYNMQVETVSYTHLNLSHGGEGTALYSTANTEIKKLCLTNGLHLLDASVRHLGTDINYVVLENLYQELKEKVDFYFESPVQPVEKSEDVYKRQVLL